MNSSANKTTQMSMGHLNLADTHILMTLYLAFAVIGILGNLSIIIIISTSSVYRGLVSCLYLVNLAVADALVCLTATPYYVMSLAMKQELTVDPLSSSYNSICKLPMFFNYFTASLRILALMTMSIDRYIAINHPYFYAHRCALDIGKRWCIVSIIYVWVQSLVTIIPPMANNRLMAIVFYGSNGRLCGIMWSKSNFAFFSIIMLMNFALPAILIVFTNCKVFFLARKHVVRERIKRQRIGASYGRSRSNTVKGYKVRKQKCSKVSVVVSKSNEDMSQVRSEQNEMISDMKSQVSTSGTNLNVPNGRTGVAIIYGRNWSPKKSKTTGSNTSLNRAIQFANDLTSHAIISKITGTGEIIKPSPTKRKHKASSEWEVALSTLALVIFYFVSYLPFMVTRLLSTSSEGGISIEVVAYTTLLTTLGSAINPIIVFKTRSEFRRILKQKLCGCRNTVDVFQSQCSSSRALEMA